MKSGDPSYLQTDAAPPGPGRRPRALSIWRQVRARPELTVKIVIALALAPFAWSVLTQFARPHAIWMNDLNAATCAGNTLLQGGSMFAQNPNCPFGVDAPYVYPPLLARMSAWLQSRYGVSFELVAIGALYGLALVGLFKSLLTGSREELLLRAPFVCVFNAKAFANGNVSILFHAALLLAAFAGSVWLLLPLVVLCAITKPTFAVFSALFLFLPGSLRRRIGLTLISLICIAGYFLSFRLSEPDLFAQWMSVASAMGLAGRGFSFINLPGVAEMQSGALRVALYTIYAAVLIACGGLVVRRRDLPAHNYAFVGVAVCALLNPRMMAYDYFTLPFGMAVVARIFAENLGRARYGLYVALAAIWASVSFTGSMRGSASVFPLFAGLLLACAAAGLARSLQKDGNTSRTGLRRPDPVEPPSKPVTEWG